VGGIALILLAALLTISPIQTFLKVQELHAKGLGPHAVGGVAYLLTTAAFCLLVGLYLLKGAKNKNG
jgi:hypothetical protein